MADSSSDSDCFESADEGFDDERIVSSDNKNSNAEKNKPNQTSHNSNEFSADDSTESTTQKDSLQYRKRPEKSKRSSKPADSFPPNRRNKSQDEHVFKNDAIKADALIQDITSNLSKNLNKGLNAVQQTSSSIKDLVMNSLPVTNLRVTSRFSYDEDENMSQSLDKNDDNISNEVYTENVVDSENVLKDYQVNTSCEQDIKIVDSVNIHDEEKEVTSDLSTMIDVMVIKSSDENQDKEHLENVEESIKYCSVRSSNNINAEEKMATDLVKKENNADVKYIDSENLVKEGTIDEESKEGISEERNFQNKNICSLGACKTGSEGLNCNDEFTPKQEIEYGKLNTEDECHDKYGWDSAELELDGLGVEGNTCNVSSVPIESETSMVSEPVLNIASSENEIKDDNEGWDDFDIDDDDLQAVNNETPVTSVANIRPTTDQCSNIHKNVATTKEETSKNFGNDFKWQGWDNFGEKNEVKPKSSWMLGSWGVNALLNTATSVTQGISNVLEAGLGAPNPEELARMESDPSNVELIEKTNKESNQVGAKESSQSGIVDNHSSSGINLFPSFGITNLVAGVTKNIVENTKVHEIGTKVITGGLDTLESFGKKTMEVLQEGDPGLKKKRALLLGSNKPILSQVLREAKSKAEIEDKKMEEKHMAKLCHFETLFDDFQGLIHLEALEMLSTQCELKLEQMKTSLNTEEVEDLSGILDEVKELCVIDEDEFKASYATMVTFKISLTKATEPLKNEISVGKIIQIHDKLEVWLKLEENQNRSSQSILQKAMSTMAELTAATVQQFHKGGELLSIKEHRKTVEEADVLLQLTGFLCCEINEISEKFLKLLKCYENESDKVIARKIKEEAENATSYIKDAFNLLIPVLQLGAAS